MNWFKSDSQEAIAGEAEPGAGAKLMARLVLAASLCAFGYSLGYQRGQAAAPAASADQTVVAAAADPYSAALFANAVTADQPPVEGGATGTGAVGPAERPRVN